MTKKKKKSEVPGVFRESLSGPGDRLQAHMWRSDSMKTTMQKPCVCSHSFHRNSTGLLWHSSSLQVQHIMHYLSVTDRHTHMNRMNCRAGVPGTMALEEKKKLHECRQKSFTSITLFASDTSGHRLVRFARSQTTKKTVLYIVTKICLCILHSQHTSWILPIC